MFINSKFLLSVVLLLSLVIPVFSFQPSGSVLVLDGEDDYAILPLAEYGYIFPKNTDEFTVEVWFYPKSEPKPIEANIVLGQQVVFGLKSHGDKDKCRGRFGKKKNEICSYGTAYFEGRVVIDIDAIIKKDQWNYLAVIFKDDTFHLAYNDQAVTGGKLDFLNFMAAELTIPEAFRDFFVGGYAEDRLIMQEGQLSVRRTYFHGLIDAIRFSNIARYDLPGKRGTSRFDPPQRFVSDAHTLALWDFNDKEGTNHFEDTSGNGRTLIGMNGATTSDALAVNPVNTSITTTWGQIKSGSF